MKQSAIDPLSGKIDVSILTTGVSAAARKRRNELTEALKKLIQSKGKVSSVNYQKTLTEMKESMQIVCLLLFFNLIIYLILLFGFNLINFFLLLAGDT